MAANIAAEIRARKLPEHAPIPVGQGDGFVQEEQLGPAAAHDFAMAAAER